MVTLFGSLRKVEMYLSIHLKPWCTDRRQSATETLIPFWMAYDHAIRYHQS